MTNDIAYRMILLYLQKVKELDKTLKTALNSEDLLFDFYNFKIPQRGVLISEGLEFSFHGIGCRVNGPDFSIDFDYGEGNFLDLFNPWRVYEYFVSINQIIDSIKDFDSFEKLCSELELKGQIIKCTKPREVGSWKLPR